MRFFCRNASLLVIFGFPSSYINFDNCIFFQGNCHFHISCHIWWNTAACTSPSTCVECVAVTIFMSDIGGYILSFLNLGENFYFSIHPAFGFINISQRLQFLAFLFLPWTLLFYPGWQQEVQPTGVSFVIFNIITNSYKFLWETSDFTSCFTL